MESIPGNIVDYTDVMNTFLQIEGVLRVHNLRIWALSINKVALSAHLAVGKHIFFLLFYRFLSVIDEVVL